MIKDFACKKTEKLFYIGKSSKFGVDIAKVAIRKLDYLNAAIDVDDLKAPPSNRLEKLQGSFEGFYSIRINDQWRIVFSFENSNAYNVQIIDYH